MSAKAKRAQAPKPWTRYRGVAIPEGDREQHIVGIRSFERVHAVDLKALAASYWRRYEAERGEGR